MNAKQEDELFSEFEQFIKIKVESLLSDFLDEFCEEFELDEEVYSYLNDCTVDNINLM